MRKEEHCDHLNIGLASVAARQEEPINQVFRAILWNCRDLPQALKMSACINAESDPGSGALARRTNQT